MIGRLIIGAAALAAAALFAVWLGSSRAEERANQIAFSGAVQDPALVAHALADARDARRLVPDAQAKFIESRLLYGWGRRAPAERLLEAILRQEPDNSGLWFVLLDTTRDRGRAREAQERLRELNPALVERGR
jgi:predicted Zn-dependent protease